MTLRWAKIRSCALLVGLAVFGAFLADDAEAQQKSQGKRYIVQFKPGRDPNVALKGSRAKVHLDLSKRNKNERAFAVTLDDRGLTSMRSRAEVAMIEEDVKRFPLSTEVTPWGVSAVGSLSQQVTASGAAMVCIIDSGYSIGHVDLPQDVSSSFDSGTGDPLEDGCGHGTHVAGTIAALQNGQGVVGVDGNKGIALHIVKVFANSCSWTYSSTLVQALNRCQQAAAASGKKLVVNMSLGGSAKSRFEEQAFADSAKAGHLSVAAAGNDGSTRMSYPASYASVVSVAAVDSNRRVASFSQRNAQVDLSAPGVDVVSTVPVYSETKVTTNTGVVGQATEIEFSPRTSSAGVGGSLVNGGLCTTSSLPSAVSGRVVVCERGSISFADKALNAQARGAVAVVIYNNVAGAFSGTLGSVATGVAVPVVAVGREDGLALLGAASQAALGTVINHVDPSRGGYASYDGTSMATPHVAAAAAALWNAVPKATASGVRSALESTAVDLGPVGRDDAYGHGFINLPRAFERLLVAPNGSGGSTCSRKRGC
jgi:serine protease